MPSPPCTRMRKHRTAGTKKLVFECQLDLPRFETLERALLREIGHKLDCLLLYRAPETRGFGVIENVIFKAVDFDGPLVLYALPRGLTACLRGGIIKLEPREP